MEPWPSLAGNQAPVALLIRSPYEDDSLLERAYESAREDEWRRQPMIFAELVRIRPDEGLLPAVLDALSEVIGTSASTIRGDRQAAARRVLVRLGGRLPAMIAEGLLGVVRQKIGEEAFKALEEGLHDARTAATPDLAIAEEIAEVNPRVGSDVLIDFCRATLELLEPETLLTLGLYGGNRLLDDDLRMLVSLGEKAAAAQLRCRVWLDVATDDPVRREALRELADSSEANSVRAFIEHGPGDVAALLRNLPDRLQSAALALAPFDRPRPRAELTALLSCTDAEWFAIRREFVRAGLWVSESGEAWFDERHRRALLAGMPADEREFHTAAAERLDEQVANGRLEAGLRQDCERIAALRVVFDRPAFRTSCIAELFLSELDAAVNDTQVALSTGRLHSRGGFLVAEVPPASAFVTARFREGLGQIADCLAAVHRAVYIFDNELAERLPGLRARDFYGLVLALGGRHPDAVQWLVDEMDAIDGVRNAVIVRMNELLDTAGLQALPEIRRSSDILYLGEFPGVEPVVANLVRPLPYDVPPTAADPTTGGKARRASEGFPFDSAEAARRQAAAAAALGLAARADVQLPDATMELVLVPDGTFLMGDDEEKPRHWVRLTHPYFLSRVPVTHAVWSAAMGHDRPPPELAERPVCVAHGEALAFLGRAAAATGLPLRLATEAEWENAARAGTETAFAFGDELTPAMANVGDDAEPRPPVGRYPANAWGLHDVHGTVGEWCQERFSGRQYLEDVRAGDPVVDPPHFEATEHDRWVTRGVSARWMEDMRSSRRSTGSVAGCRVAVDAEALKLPT